MNETERIIAAKKQQLRENLLQQRQQLSSKKVAEASNNICKGLTQLAQQQGPNIIHAYLPIRNEVNIIPFLKEQLQQGVRVVVPKVIGKRQLEHVELLPNFETETGLHKTLQPKSAAVYKGLYDWILVPGVGYDRYGMRLGYGGGYYDTFLADNGAATRIAPAYNLQLVKKIPTSQHDQPVHQIVTESEIIQPEEL
jgi:5-formyltetrahydrofolate cyclo-ligase